MESAGSRKITSQMGGSHMEVVQVVQVVQSGEYSQGRWDYSHQCGLQAEFYG